MSLVPPAIILVQPQMGENIGMCARAMLNCGVTDLRLVAPRDGWPNAAAHSASAGAVAVIDRARVYPDLATAMCDIRYAVAATARPRGLDKPVLMPDAAIGAMTCVQSGGKAARCAIVFGPERAGLVNDDIALCDAIVNVPLNPAYASLNLAQAVLLLCYEWRKTVYADDFVATPEVRPSATQAETTALFDHLATALDASGYFAVPGKRAANLLQLRNTLQKADLSSREIHGVHGMLKAITRKNKQS